MMKPYWKITLWYLVFGVLWIFCSDKLLRLIATDLENLTQLQTLKGWFYVAISGLLVFQLTRQSYHAEERKKSEVFHIFKTTVRGVHHILFNYLNQMQLLTLEAERSHDFDRAVIDLSKEISQEAETALIRLGEIEKITPENIHSVVYGTVSE